MKGWMRLLACAVVASSLPSLALCSGLAVDVKLHALAVDEDGTAREVGSAGSRVAPGRRAFAAVDAGAGPCLCTMGGTRGGSTPIDPAEITTGRVAWLVELEVLDVSIAEIRLRAHWRRLSRADRAWREDRRASELLSFRPADGRARAVVPLDLLHERGPDCPHRRLQVGVSASVVEEPALADARFEVDAWLEHVGEGGRLHARRTRVVVQQGLTEELGFEPLRWPAPGVEDHEILLEVLGRIRARVRPDASIEVALDVDRWIDVARTASPRGGGVSDGGRKTFVVLDGETVRMELPRAPHARFAFDSNAAGEARSVTDSPRWMDGLPVRVDAGAFLREHADALVLTVTRID